MPVKINGATSGSVTLAAPATGSDVTLTLPTTGFGKLLQVVRATDTTRRTTTSTSYVDVTNMSITITPTSTTSNILVVATFLLEATSSNFAIARITTSGNTPLSGANYGSIGISSSSGAAQASLALFGWSSPATTAATTYKVRFCINTAGTATMYNDIQDGQLLAFEIGA